MITHITAVQPYFTPILITYQTAINSKKMAAAQLPLKHISFFLYAKKEQTFQIYDPFGQKATVYLSADFFLRNYGQYQIISTTQSEIGEEQIKKYPNSMTPQNSCCEGQNGGKCISRYASKSFMINR